MKNWKGLCKGVNESVFGRICFFFISMTLIVWCYLANSERIYQNEIVVQEDNFTWMFQIDSTTEISDKVQFKGWAFQISTDAKRKNCVVVLRDIKNGEMIYTDMQYDDRADVNAYFLCEKDYTRCGFIATVNTEKLDMENAIYEFVLRKTASREAFATGIYYSEGKIVYTNPEEVIPLETEGTDLEQVTENGILLMYRPDVHAYVYQYEGSLYWIVEEEYDFVDGDTFIQFQMNTTQPENLPEDRLENGWMWSNIGFLFSKKELTDWNTGKYRVAVRKIPTDYSVTNVWTGNYIETWLWKETFRIRYEFEK